MRATSRMPARTDERDKLDAVGAQLRSPPQLEAASRVRHIAGHPGRWGLATMPTVDAAAAESRSFEADVSKLLHLMVHSVYSDREIFLRELVSNAADACEKLRFERIAN